MQVSTVISCAIIQTGVCSKPAETHCQQSCVFGEQTGGFHLSLLLKEHLREQEFHMDDDVIQEDLQRFMDQPKEFYAAGIQKFTASVAMAGELH